MLLALRSTAATTMCCGSSLARPAGRRNVEPGHVRRGDVLRPQPDRQVHHRQHHQTVSHPAPTARSPSTSSTPGPTMNAPRTGFPHPQVRST
jgi:hypothetical protein